MESSVPPILQSSGETYLDLIRQKATDNLRFYKKNRYLIGRYKSVICYNYRYFSKASKRTILAWNRTLKMALEATKEAFLRTQTLITKFYPITKVKTSSGGISSTQVQRQPRLPWDVFLSQFRRLPDFYPNLIPSDRPPPEPDPTS